MASIVDLEERRLRKELGITTKKSGQRLRVTGETTNDFVENVRTKLASLGLKMPEAAEKNIRELLKD